MPENKPNLTLAERIRAIAISLPSPQLSSRNSLNALANKIAALEAELADLRSKLAFTADGVLIECEKSRLSLWNEADKHDDMHVIALSQTADTREWIACLLIGDERYPKFPINIWVKASDCYSTSAARDAAKVSAPSVR